MHVLSNNITSSAGAVSNTYAPLTLAQTWTTTSRFMIVSIFCIIGSFMNIMYLASFFVDQSLKRIGFIFMGLASLSDLIITSVILPIVSVELAHGQPDNVYVCRTAQFLVEAASYSYNLFYALIAVECYYRHCRSAADYDWFMSMRLRFLCTSVYTFSISAAAVGVLLGLDYDYCERKRYGVYNYRVLTSILFYAIPCFITVLGLSASLHGIGKRINSSAYYRRSEQSVIDSSICSINMTAYIIYIVCWTPYLKVMYSYPDIDDSIFYTNAWLGICRSVFTSFLYVMFVKKFTCAYVNLIKYCFCRRPLVETYSSRFERSAEYRVATGDVRIHLMTPTRQPAASFLVGVPLHDVFDL